MKQAIMNKNKRTHPRYRALDNVFAALDFGFTKVGRLIDVSRSGASFEYFMFDNISIESEGEIDIFVSGKKFYLSNVPYNLIYNNSELHVSPYTSSLITSRCGLKFGDLSQDQQISLENLLNTYTVH